MNGGMSMSPTSVTAPLICVKAAPHDLAGTRQAGDVGGLVDQGRHEDELLPGGRRRREGGRRRRIVQVRARCLLATPYARVGRCSRRNMTEPRDKSLEFKLGLGS